MTTQTEKAQAAPTLTDRHFQEVKIEETGAMLDRTELAAGAVVRYLRSKRIDTRGGKSDVHTFVTPTGELFSVWGTKQLGDKLKLVRRGAVILVRYAGQEEESRVHNWTVSTYNGSPAELKNLIDAEWKARHEMLLTAIAAAEKRENERRASNAASGRDDGPPPPDDNDAPWGT